MLYLKRSTGSEVRPVQLENVFWKPDVETAVLYLKRSTGSEVRPVQPKKVVLKFDSPGILGTIDVVFSRGLSVASLPSLMLPPEAKPPLIFG